MTNISLAESTEMSSIGIFHLRRSWEKTKLKKSAVLHSQSYSEEWKIDTTMFAALGLGLEPTLKYMYSNNGDFNEFESWIRAVTNNNFNLEKINEFNNYILKRHSGVNDQLLIESFLTSEQINFWDENGYLIIPKVVSKGDCDDAIDAICSFININRNDPATCIIRMAIARALWYSLPECCTRKNRRSSHIRKAFEQLWNRSDLWLNTDRAGFNPPETEGWQFPGPHLHWDVSLSLPIPFGLQGILYLSDTAEDQGAFTLIPGFHKNIDAWLKNLPPGTNPRDEDLTHFNPKPIAANTGDFIIWHQALPHGSSVNRSNVPRFVQYINLAPLDIETREEWI